MHRHSEQLGAWNRYARARIHFPLSAAGARTQAEVQAVGCCRATVSEVEDDSGDASLEGEVPPQGDT